MLNGESSPISFPSYKKVFNDGSVEITAGKVFILLLLKSNLTRLDNCVIESGISVKRLLLKTRVSKELRRRMESGNFSIAFPALTSARGLHGRHCGLAVWRDPGILPGCPYNSQRHFLLYLSCKERL